MKTKLSLITCLLFCITTIFFTSCDGNNDDSFKASGTVVGKYLNGQNYSTIIQLDKKYSFGETMEYTGEVCFTMIGADVYKNAIQVQPQLYEIGDRIKFSCLK